MSVKEPWYLTERAEQMARVFLTRSDHISVSTAPSRQGLDLLGWVDSPAHLFGVVVKSAVHLEELVKDGRRLKSRLAQEVVGKAQGYPFPVVLLLFDMHDDSGYFGWLQQPFTDPATQRAGLHLVHHPEVRSLTDEGLKEIVVGIRGWYDAGGVLTS